MTEDEVAYVRLASQAIDQFRGKWKIEVLCTMRDGPVRMSQLLRAISGASKKALTKHLRELELSGLVVRRDLSKSVLHVEYEFTDNMRESTCSMLDTLAAWSKSFQ